MNGREERDLIAEKKIQELISGKPAFITEYYVWLEGRASLTKLRYINYLLDFLHFYEQNEGVTITGWKDFQVVDSANLSRYFNYISYTRDSQGQPIKKCQASIVGTKLSAMKTFFSHPKFEGRKNPIELLGRRPKRSRRYGIILIEKMEDTETMNSGGLEISCFFYCHYLSGFVSQHCNGSTWRILT